uniref:Plant heme peroxidase family profile domain-containing protein n=1 Tax=Lactuca sativa TaxID=4236 RepID=A0A9R1XNE6_LACSA|nr:hypothetical protein LSAT_V11C300129390 [Lactuca sativa]
MIKTLMSARAPVLAEKYSKEIENARRDLRALIVIKKCAPIMFSLALHDAWTYDANTKKGGPNGSIRNYIHGENTGLKTAIDLCEEVKDKHPRVTYADLYQLAGVVAIELIGGPTIDYAAGRKDSKESHNEGLLPDAKEGPSHLRDEFYGKGLSDKDIVALSAIHKLVNAHPERSGFGEKPLKFDNSYFVELLKGDSDSDGSLQHATGKALLMTQTFVPMLSFMQRKVRLFNLWAYVQDEDVFLKDYAESHKKVSELGVTLPLSQDASFEARGAVNLASSATLVFLNFSSMLLVYIQQINRKCKE